MVSVPLLALSAWLPSASAADVRFVVVGDTQAESGDSYNPDVLPALVEDINARAPDFAFFVGDLTNGAGTLGRQVEVWEEWIAATDGLVPDRYATAGNHDFFAGAGVKPAWAATFDFLPRDNSPAGEEALTYWFDVGDSRFISVLSDGDGGANVMPDVAWLESVLAASTHKAHVFVLTHHPVSWSTYDTAMGGTQGAFWQLLLQYEVDALLTGHWHLYQPGQLGGGAMASGHAGSAETWEIIGGVGGGYQGYDPVRPSNLGYGFIEIAVDGDEVTATWFRDDDGDGHHDDVADQFTLTYARTRARGLVAWYPLDADLEDHAPTDIGYAIHGGVLGDAALVTDTERGSVLALDGTGDAVEAAAVDAYHHSLKGDLAVSVYARSDGLDGGTWDNALVAYATNDYYTEDEETNYAYWLSVEADGTLRAFWEYGDGVNVVVRSTVPAPVDDAWHQLGFTRDTATRRVQFYVDGAPLGAPVPFDHLPSGASRGFLYLGADTVDNDASYWRGALDEVCLFDRVLAADEMAALHADGGCAAFTTPTDPGDSGTTDSGPTDTDLTDTDATDTDATDTDLPDTDIPDTDDLDPPTKDPGAPGCGCGGGVGAPGGVLAEVVACIVAGRRRQGSSSSSLR